MFDKFIYFVTVWVLTSGFILMLGSPNYIKKAIGLGILQLGVLLFYVSLSKNISGVVPILNCNSYDQTIYTNPLPHVLMLTAIVVGVATLSVALGLIIKINKTYGAVDEDIIFGGQDE